MRRALSIAAAAAGTGLCLWFALRKVEFPKLAAAFAAADWVWLAPMAVIVLLDLVVRGARWRVLLSRARPDASIAELTRLEAVGIAVNNVLFARIGEFARAALAGRRLGIPTFAALASVAVERAFDVAALLSIFLIATVFAPGFAPDAVRAAAAAVLAAAVAALVVLAVAETWVAEGGWIERWLRPWPKLHALVEQLVLGAAVLRSPRAAAEVAAWSFVLWTVDAGIYWAGARALGFGDRMNYARAVLTLSWAGASSALPAAPGGIGAFELMVEKIVIPFGAGADQALAYALVCHMTMFVSVTVLGLIFLSRLGLSLAELRGEVAKT
jgi:uncharacterized membrane protein YbhN (UPF0104 family)